MSEFHVIMPCGTEKDGFNSYSDAEDGADLHADLCESCNDPMAAVIEPVDQPAKQATADGGPQAVSEPSEAPPEAQDPEIVASESLPDEKPPINQDPVDWMPSHFVDQIQGVPTLNRKGYAVMCERFGVSVTSEPVTLASETDFEHAEFHATATTADGQEYSGFGSANVERGEGENADDEMLLNELAETRAMKRAASWATGVGMTAASELSGDLE